MWEKRQDRGRVKSKVGSRGLFADSFVSLFLTLTIITFITKNVVDSYFNSELSVTKYYRYLTNPRTNRSFSLPPHPRKEQRRSPRKENGGRVCVTFLTFKHLRCFLVPGIIF